MAHITRTELDVQHIKLDVTLSPKDYIGRFEKEIKSLSRNAQVKGFRPGKTPPTLIKKMYGNNVLLDTVQDILTDELYAYLDDTKPNIIGSPIMSEVQPQNKMSLTHPSDITFSYEIGLRPELDLSSVETMKFNRYKIEVPDALVDETVERIRTSYKQNVDIFEGAIEPEDSFKIDFKELDGTLTGETTLSIKFLTEEMTPKFIGLKIGEKILANIFELEKNSDVASVKKYILGLDADDDRHVTDVFELTVKSIVRSQPGEVNEGMFESVFPGKEIKDELTFREVLRSELEKNDNLLINRLLSKEILEKLSEKFQLSLPDNFMKLWLISQEKDRSKSKAVVEQQYPLMAETMKNNVLLTGLIERYELTVTDEELLDFLDKNYGVQFGVPSLGKELAKMIFDKMKAEKSQDLDRYAQVIVEDKLGNYFHTKGWTTDVPTTTAEIEQIWKKYIGREDELEFLGNEGVEKEFEETPIEVVG